MLLKLIKLFTRVVLVFVSLVLLIPIMVMLFLLTLISFQGPFTYVNKCCNNFVFVCKKFYVSSVFSELNSHVGAYVVSNLAQSDILKFHLSFNKANHFKGVKCGPRLSFLCVVWKFHKNPIKPRFICAASSSSLTDVSKWMCSFFKAMFPMVNDLWVSKLKKADVPCDSSWILNDFTGVVEVINNLGLPNKLCGAGPWRVFVATTLSAT